jgi:hypothetical protein
MQIYWSHKSIPELAGLPPDERHRIWRAGFWKAHRHWQVWVVVASYGFLIPIGADMGALAGSQMIGMFVAAGVGSFLYSQVVTDYARPYFRSYAALYPPTSLRSSRIRAR